MSDAPATSASVAAIAAMVTPGLLMLGSASLAASALVRMARVVDRARALADIARDGSWAASSITQDQLRAWLERHAQRARYAMLSIALLYAAIVVFVATCLAIAANEAIGPTLNWLPLTLAISGTLLLLGGAVAMVAESKLSGEQIAEEIRIAMTRLEGARK
jgi:hypothetical protein